MSESMMDMAAALEESYKMMGDGVHSTDDLLAWENAAKLMESGEVITVEVLTTTKGGALCNVDGLRGFIPASKLALEYVENIDAFIGKKLQVQVITADMDEDKLVLSAVELLKAKKNADREKQFATVSVGDVMTGKVDSLQNYGAFIDLGDGLSGLVHISQISLDRLKHPKQALEIGQEVTVKVIDKKDGKISLSIRALLEENDKEEEVEYELPQTEEIGTSLGSLLDGFVLK